MILEKRPELYKYRDNIGGLDVFNRTFTDVALYISRSPLLKRMKLSPSEIASIYFRKTDITMKDVINWDMPMQDTYIFSATLFREQHTDREIRDLLSMGYVPTKQDIYRYGNIFGVNNIYKELVSKHKEILYMRDILVGTRYESYRRFVAMNNHSKVWNSWRDIIGRNNVNTISPFHYIELRTNSSKYVVPISQIDYKNPYTNEFLDRKTYIDIQKKKEFLRMNGFPLEPIDMNHKFDMGWKPEIEILSSRLGVNLYIIDTREYILHMLNMEDKPIHIAYQILNTYIDFDEVSVNDIKHHLQNFILQEIDAMDDE